MNTVFHSNSVKCLFSHLLQYSAISIFSGHASCVLTSQFTPQPPLVCGRVYVTVQSPSVPAINRCSSVRRVCCRRPSGQDIDRLLHDQQQRRCSSTAHSSKGQQCCVYGRRRRLHTQWCIEGGIRRIPTSGFFDSVIINKQCTFRPFATPLCVYPPPFLAIHHCAHRLATTAEQYYE